MAHNPLLIQSAIKCQVIGVFFAFVTSAMLASFFPTRAAEIEIIDACVDRISDKMQPGVKSREVLWDAASFCQTLATARRLGEEQHIRADNLIFQRFENNVLMWMVVSITIAGVLLAGAQLWASYMLAKSGRGALVEGGSVDLSKDKLAVQSSVVGVIVLAVSFAFFLVFVLYVYTFHGPDEKKTRTAEEPPRQVSSEPLQPSPTPPAPVK